MFIRRQAAFYAILLLCLAVPLLYLLCFNKDEPSTTMVPPNKHVVGSNQSVYEYNRDMPLIFVDGVPGSGTTLMRAMLDAHPDVRCGQETRVIPTLLLLHSGWMESESISLRLEEAGITKEVLDSAMAAYALEIIVKHGAPAPRLCNKDAFILTNSGRYVVDLFPNVKFILMVRDGRAAAHSIISRKLVITGFNVSSYRQCLELWNEAVSEMYYQCEILDPERCLKVHYEQLVLHPRTWMEKVLNFLDIPWNEAVLHHHDFINNGVDLSKVEPSSGQVIKPVNLDALTKWVGAIPKDVLEDMVDIAPMLAVLGYDPYANPPNYGKPDEEVFINTKNIQEHKGDWEKKAKEFRYRMEEEDLDQEEEDIGAL